MSATAPRTDHSPRGLAIVRCGDRSLHESWAAGTTLFDVAVSYFGADENRTFPEARFVHRYKGGKWDGIADFFDVNPGLIDRYDYFWLPDDDLELCSSKLDKLLEIGITHRLDLWQPGLDSKSFYSHLITLAIDGSFLRYTNFIEIMAPFISQRLLKNTLSIFSETMSGFGLDYLWPQRAGDLNIDGDYSCAIVDSVTMTHTRPIGSALRSTISATGGLTQRQEYALMLKRVRSRNPLFRSMMLPVPRKRVFVGRDPQGRILGRWELFVATLRHLSRNSRGCPQSVRRWDLARHLATAFF